MQNPPPSPAGKSALGLEPNVVALLCYLGNVVCALGLILSIITVVTDKVNKLARFHAFQSILLSVLGIVLLIVYWVLMFAGLLIDNALGSAPIFTLLCGGIVGLIGLALFIGVIIAAIKGFQGQIFKLPIIGNIADNLSN
jgi:uncharacterized membrane protein